MTLGKKLLMSLVICVLNDLLLVGATGQTGGIEN